MPYRVTKLAVLCHPNHQPTLKSTLRGPRLPRIDHFLLACALHIPNTRKQHTRKQGGRKWLITENG